MPPVQPRKHQRLLSSNAWNWTAISPDTIVDGGGVARNSRHRRSGQLVYKAASRKHPELGESADEATPIRDSARETAAIHAATAFRVSSVSSNCTGRCVFFFMTIPGLAQSLP